MFQLLDFIIPPKQLLKGTKCFLWKETQKVDYNYWKNGDLMKNECMVPPVTRYENSTSLETLLSCLLTSAAHWAHQNTFLSDTIGKSSLLSESRAVSSDTAKQGQHSTFHRACRAAENISMACLQEEAHSAQALSCLQTQIQS